MAEAEYARELAKKCFRLVRSINDPKAIADIERFGRELERRAEELERRCRCGA